MKSYTFNEIIIALVGISLKSKRRKRKFSSRLASKKKSQEQYLKPPLSPNCKQSIEITLNGMRFICMNLCRCTRSSHPIEQMRRNVVDFLKG